jgi:hypothetical protein
MRTNQPVFLSTTSADKADILDIRGHEFNSNGPHGGRSELTIGTSNAAVAADNVQPRCPWPVL